MIEEFLAGGGRNSVVRIGDAVHRQTGPWATSVHALLHHLRDRGFEGAPRVVGTGFDPTGREVLSYIDGATPRNYKWNTDAMPAVGALLRAAHDAAASFVPPVDAVWREWFGRELGDANKIIGHCDTGPWNIVARDGMPVAFIDWEEAGPVDPLVDLAQTCWLNAQVYDDDIGERDCLAPAAERARHLRSIVDGYGLARAGRTGLLQTIIEFAVHAAANEARVSAVTPDSTDIVPLWAVAWRTRSASWLLRNRSILEAALL